MTKHNKSEDRSILTTITATIIGLLISAVTFLILPINNITAGVSFGIGVSLVIICIVIAIEGKKGTIKELIYSMLFWR